MLSQEVEHKATISNSSNIRGTNTMQANDRLGESDTHVGE